MVLSLLNYDGDHQEDVFAKVHVEVGAPDGFRIAGAQHTDGTAIEHSISADGSRFVLDNYLLEIFAQIEITLSAAQ